MCSRLGYSEYKQVRNSIRKYNREDLLWSLITLTCKVSRSEMVVWQKGFVPWELLLFAKWIIVDWSQINGTQKVDQNALNILINNVKKFVDIPDPLLKQGDQGITKFMRRLAFQQFWHQKKLAASNAGRTIKLLLEPTFSSALEDKILSKLRLTRAEIIELMLMVWAGFLGKDNITHLKEDFFFALEKTLSKEKVRALFDLFSVHVDNIAEYGSGLATPKNYFNEIYERPPFLKKPFIENRNGDIHLWSLAILNEIIEHGIYDLVKSVDSSKFGDEFGVIFEKYLESQLSLNKLPYNDEKSQKKKGYEQQVDFILENEDSFVFVEAKGIEASPLTQVVPFDEIMSNAYKKNIVKALFQAHSVNSRLINDGNKKIPYLLVVSYKELYLGNGENVLDEFIATTLRDEYGVTELSIPPENIFFVSVDGFDKLLICSEEQTDKVVNVLKLIVTKKKDIKDKKFIFTQYLEDLDGIKLKDRTENNLNDKFNEFHQKLVEKYFPGHKKI